MIVEEVGYVFLTEETDQDVNLVDTDANKVNITDERTVEL